MTERNPRWRVYRGKVSGMWWASPVAYDDRERLAAFFIDWEDAYAYAYAMASA